MPTPQQMKERREKFLKTLPDKIHALANTDAPIPFLNDPIKLASLYIHLKRNISPDSDMEAEEKQEKFNYWVKYIGEGKSSVYKELMSHPEEYRSDMAIDYAEDDRKLQQDYAFHKANMPTTKSEAKKPNDVEGYAQKTEFWEKTLFGPETDRTAFKKLTIPSLVEAHEKIDAEKIPLPAGMTEKEGRELVIAAVFSEFAKPESILKIGHRVNEIEGNISSTVAKLHPEETSDKYYIWDGRTFLFDNTLTTQDGRDNSYVPRLMGPEFRQHAKEILATYPSDPAVLAKHLKAGFDSVMLEANAGGRQRDRYHSYYPAEMAIRIYKILSGPQFKDYVTFNDRDKQMLSYLEADTKMTMRYGTLANELKRYAFEKSLRGSDLPPSADPTYRDMLMEYKALSLYFTRKKRDVDYIQGRMLEIEGTSAEMRNLTQIEKDLADDPEGYVNRMRTLIAASPENQALKNTLDDWDSALKSLPKHLEVGTNIGEKESSLITPEFERTVMPVSIRKTVDALKQYLTLPKEPKVIGELYAPNRTRKQKQDVRTAIEMLENLPCMKGDFISNNTSEEELKNLADQYDKVREFLNEKSISARVFTQYTYDEHGRKIGKESQEQKLTEDLCIDLRREVTALRGLPQAFANEKAFIQGTFEAITKAAEARTASLTEGVRDYGDLSAPLCGRPTPAYCDAMFADAIKENGERLEKYPGYKDAMKMINEHAFQPHTARMKAYSMLEKVQDEMSEKMLDDDSESLMQDYTAITRIMSALSLRIDAKEPVPGSEAYQRVYDKLGTQMQHMDKDMEALEPNSKMHELAVRAKDAMEKVQRAVAGECFGDRGPDVDNLANLKDSDALSVISAYQIMSASQNPKLQTLMESKGVDKLIKSIDSSDQLKANKKNLTIQGLSNILESGNGFGRLMQQPQGNNGPVNGVKAPVNSNERTSNASVIGGGGH